MQAQVPKSASGLLKYSHREKYDQSIMGSTCRAFSFKCSPSLAFSTKTRMDATPRSLHNPFTSSASRSPPWEASLSASGDGSVTEQEWQAWGTSSPLPSGVERIVEDLKDMERDADAHMSFGGNGGKLQVWNQKGIFSFAIS